MNGRSPGASITDHDITAPMHDIPPAAFKENTLLGQSHGSIVSPPRLAQRMLLPDPDRRLLRL